MTAIKWGPERKYTGNGECPEDARDVPCMVKSKFGDWFGITLGRCWYWEDFTAYRLPETIPIAMPVPADPVLADLVYAASVVIEGFDAGYYKESPASNDLKRAITAAKEQQK